MSKNMRATNTLANYSTLNVRCENQPYSRAKLNRVPNALYRMYGKRQDAIKANERQQQHSA